MTQSKFVRWSLALLVALSVGACAGHTKHGKPQPPPPAMAPAAEAPDEVLDDDSWATASVLSDLPRARPNTVRIGTFNIQVFGPTKAAKPEVMEVLANIVRNLDIVAIQEIRDSSGQIIPKFLDLINEDGAEYAVVVGPALGSGSHREKYAFIYDTRVVSFIDGSDYTFNDRGNAFARGPFVATFKAGDFDFSLVNIHTQPTAARTEIAALASVVQDALRRQRDEKDIIVLGDYNAGCSYFSGESEGTPLQSAAYVWVVPDDTDTTTRESTSCAYDRIVFRGNATSDDFAGRWDVFRFDETYGLSEDETVDVSDHFPVWADFHTDRDSDGPPPS